MSMASTCVCQRSIRQPSSFMTGCPFLSMQTSVVVPPTSTTKALSLPAVAPNFAVAAGPLAMVMAALSATSSRVAPLPSPQIIVTGQERPTLIMERWIEARKSTIKGCNLACRQAVAARSRIPAWVLTRCEQKTGLGSIREIASSATSSWTGFSMDMALQTA